MRRLPLPRIDATLDLMGGSAYFTAFDLTAGFWQVGMKPEDAEKTAFVTPDGLYEFTAMPMGLANSPATFQRLMHSVLAPLGVEYAMAYLDDVMVHSKNWEDHLRHIENVLLCVKKAGLCVKLKKCSFGAARTNYLGHVISAEGIEPQAEKVAAVKEFQSRCAPSLASWATTGGLYLTFQP